MITTLLFDLDDTLLANPMETFLPAYFVQLARHFDVGEASAPHLMDAVLSSTNLMAANVDPLADLLTVFNTAFYPAMRWQPEQYLPRFDDFYRNRFAQLQPWTQTLPAARAVMEWAFDAGYQVVIATSPLFPLVAIQERLRWAGVADFPYALVTAVETSHFVKPRPEYFAEILARVGKRPEEALVVGNDWEADLVPAARLGLPHYWVAPPGRVPPANGAHPVGVGGLEAFLEWAKSNLATFQPAAAPASAQPFLMAGNLAEACRLLAGVPEAVWARRPAEGEWSLVEIVCHLRDVDREVNYPRLRAVVENDNPFLSGVDTDPWAAERGYPCQSGLEARQEFAAARQQICTLLSGVPDAAWHRPARHAVLGNTHLAELVGWILDHDRVHLAQLRTTRQKAIQ